MKAGIGRRIITPPVGVWMAGYASRDRPSEGVADDLIVKALSLEDDAGRQAVIVTADLIGFHPSITEPVRAAIRESHPTLPGDAVLFNASHTHSGPVVHIERSYLTPEQYSASYVAHLTDQTRDAVRDALDSMTPCEITLHEGHTSLGINRRKEVNGAFRMVPNPDGFIDRGLAALRVQRSGATPVVLFTIACHPTTLSWYRFSGDYPGFAQRILEGRLGAGSQAMFAQGACGDVRVNVTDPETGRFRAGRYEEARAFGETLAEEVTQALSREGEPVRLSLSARRSRVPVPLQPPRPRAELERIVTETTNAALRRWAEHQLSVTEPMRRTGIHVHWLRLSDRHQIVGVGGEVCGGLGRAAREQFPDRRTLFFGYTEEVMGYIPTRAILQEGGYEGRESFIYSDLPAPFAFDMPEALLAGIRALASERGEQGVDDA